MSDPATLCHVTKVTNQIPPRRFKRSRHVIDQSESSTPTFALEVLQTSLGPRRLEEVDEQERWVKEAGREAADIFVELSGITSEF